MPTWLLKECVTDLVPAITSIINASIKLSHVPSSFKVAHIKPLIKKPSLDQDILKNYRPVSNLTFISKILEKVVLKQLEDHMLNNQLMDEFQSVYRTKHSTETALLKVQSDVLSALDKEGSIVVMIMLDLSAAFDTIDHEFLLSRLRDMFGIQDQALVWIRSYLSDRLQRVNIKGTLSGTLSDTTR